MLLFFFFFKQKTAYEMRISDWSSDVCSSDLVQQTSATRARLRSRQAWKNRPAQINGARTSGTARLSMPAAPPGSHSGMPARDRKSVVEGKRVSVRVDIGGRRLNKKKKKNIDNTQLQHKNIIIKTKPMQ